MIWIRAVLLYIIFYSHFSIVDIESGEQDSDISLFL